MMVAWEAFAFATGAKSLNGYTFVKWTFGFFNRRVKVQTPLTFL